jgi:hypothetical protein
MTREEAKSELMQIYGLLSEERKIALDVAFKAMEQADNIPVMYYPQVDGITPTVVAQADGEKSFKMRDATPEEQKSVDDYIKSISKPTGINFWDLDDNDDCISRKAVLSLLADHFDNVFEMVKELPSVVIPSAEPKTGHWIEEFNDLEGEVRFTCSSCGKYQLFETDFCYNCGAEMFEPQERSE